jgi:hypothetical protein
MVYLIILMCLNKHFSINFSLLPRIELIQTEIYLYNQLTSNLIDCQSIIHFKLKFS